MMKTAAMILLLMTTTVASAGDWYWGKASPDNMLVPVMRVPNPITEEEVARLQPSEENKKWFLERGYKLNDDKMCCGFIDVPKPVKTERIIPIAKTEDRNEIDEQADVDWEARRKFMHRTFRATRKQLTDNVCEEHGMRKVTTADGKSWHCRK